MSEEKIYPVEEKSAARSLLDPATYQELYKQSIESPEEFWAEQAGKFLHWHKPWQNIHKSDFGNAEAEWFSGGKLNVSFNCIDRHLDRHAEQTAIIWEGDEPSDDKKDYLS